MCRSRCAGAESPHRSPPVRIGWPLAIDQHRWNSANTWHPGATASPHCLNRVAHACTSRHPRSYRLAPQEPPCASTLPATTAARSDRGIPRSAASTQRCPFSASSRLHIPQIPRGPIFEFECADCLHSVVRLLVAVPTVLAPSENPWDRGTRQYPSSHSMAESQLNLPGGVHGVCNRSEARCIYKSIWCIQIYLIASRPSTGAPS